MHRVFYFFQAVLKYFPFKLGIVLRRVLYSPFLKEMGKGVVIHDNVIIKFPAEISLGNNVNIMQGCVLVGGKGLSIGNDVLIGGGTKIVTSTHHFKNTETPMRLQGLGFSPIVIENDVWFGFNCVVLGGTTIKTGSIIAANAVITDGVVEEFSIMGGVPAKLIKKRK